MSDPGIVPFERGPGPFCSVLFPTRKRAAHLLEAVDSIVSLAARKDELELVFKVDHDDRETADAISYKIAPLIRTKLLVSPRDNGYFDMHLWVNDMSRLATGDWLFLFNDDARMKTESWDVILSNANLGAVWHRCSDVYGFVAPTLERPNAQEFLFIRRKAFEILGHWALNPHNDNWMASVLTMCRSLYASPIEIEHLSAVIDDEVRGGSVEAYKTTGKHLNSPAMIWAMYQDGGKLIDYVMRWREKYGLDSESWSKIKEG